MWSQLFTAVLLVLTHLSSTESKDLFVDEGKTITFDLPSVTKCGNYQFLNPQLSPLIIIKNQSAAAIQGGYVKRTSVYVLENSQLRLTLQNVTPVDRGKYSVFTKTGDTLQCSKINYYLNVQAQSAEQLSPWGPWSECSSWCVPSAQRSRERNCSVPGGCEGLGQRVESEACQLQHRCRGWSEWSSWTVCGGCGQGHRTRNRTCTIFTNTDLPRTASCPVEDLQDELCQAEPCRVNATFWSPWGSWSTCNLTCGGGYRQRTRKSMFPDSEVVASFAGWSSEEERCNTFECEENNQASAESTNDGSSTVTLIIASAIVVSIIVLLIVILLLVLKLRKKDTTLLQLARNFRQSLGNIHKPISVPEIPRKASEPNAYSGVKVGGREKKRLSDLFKKDKRKSEGEIASSVSVSVNSVSYTKRGKSEKSKGKKKSEHTGIRISGPMHKTSTHIRPDIKMLTDTPRSSKSLTENELNSDVSDADDTYEIPVNHVWNEDTSSQRTGTPDIIITESEPVAFTNIPKNNFSTGLSDAESHTGSHSACSSPGYSSKFPSSIGVFSLYDTPRSSHSNLTDLIYDVPHNNEPVEPLYENDTLSATDEEFYVTPSPKVSVSSMAST